MTWFVTKRGDLPYGGPSWAAVGVEPRWFETEAEASEAAKKLSEYNPVGFTTKLVPDGWEPAKYPRMKREERP